MTVSYPDDGEVLPPAGRVVFSGIGDTVGPYRLLRLLGEGTTGRVFEVEHLRIGRHAAMKIVHSDSVLPGVVRRMFAEAEAVNAIGNPHIVEITDVLEPSAGHPVHALVMELLEGTVLADLIADRKPLPVARLLPIMAQICEALSAVHAAGFVHRDLKPENVFLIQRDSKADFVKLLDFGLVKAVHPDERSPRATVEGTFVGSPAYASPEQAAGKQVDWRTDIYAVGVMLYELTTGQLPFDAASIGDVLIKQIAQPPPHLPEQLLDTKMGQALDTIIQRCLAKDAQLRVDSAKQLAETFRQLGSGNTAAVAPPAASGVARRLDARVTRGLGAILRPIVAIAAAALFLGRDTGASQVVIHAEAAPPSAVVPATAETQPPPARDDRSETPRPPAAPATDKAEPSVPRPARRASRPPERERIGKATTLDPYR